MYELLKHNTDRAMAEAQWSLVHCNDVYRLAKILGDFKAKIESLEGEAMQLVKEVECG